MDPLQAALLGLVQGLTEFLPVSSSGHLVIAEHLLGTGRDGILFEIVVHLGSLFAIVAFYRERIIALARGFLARDEGELEYLGKLALATLPAVGVGLTLRTQVEALFDSPWVAGLALLATGLALITTRRTVTTASRPAPTWGQAFWIGCAQALAIVPGISRSGATVAAALAVGVAPLAATEFVFLMGVIAIAGAAVMAAPDVGAASAAELAAFGVGGLSALVSGLAALWLFVRLLRAGRFHVFAYYAWAVGAAFLLWLGLVG